MQIRNTFFTVEGWENAGIPPQVWNVQLLQRSLEIGKARAMKNLYWLKRKLKQNRTNTTHVSLLNPFSERKKIPPNLVTGQDAGHIRNSDCLSEDGMS